MAVFSVDLNDTLPSTVTGTAGPITVGRTPTVRDKDGHDLLGEWTPGNRHIVVVSTASRRAAWLTFWHEMVHSWLDDSGVGCVLTADQQEAVCESVALGLTRMMEGERP